MLKLPSKPKAKIEDAGNGRYTITFLSPVKDKVEFERLVRLFLEKSLNDGDALSNPQWDTRTITLSTSDIGAFERKLMYIQIVTGITFNPKA